MEKQLLRIAILLLLTSGLSGPEAFAQANWSQYYQPIESAYAEKHARLSFDFAESLLGRSQYPVRKIILRSSEPIHSHKHLQRNFQLAEIQDATKGEYTLYLSAHPKDYPFLGQLAHESCHLLNPNLKDAYMEGLCTVVAEEYIRAEGLDWKSWYRYFESGHEPFYSQTYFMMREIYDLMGSKGMQNFHTFVTHDKNTGNPMIDINAWLATKTEKKSQKIKRILKRYTPTLQATLKKESNQSTFLTPA